MHGVISLPDGTLCDKVFYITMRDIVYDPWQPVTLLAFSAVGFHKLSIVQHMKCSFSHNQTQMVTEPIRYENVLDLFLTNNSTLDNKVEIIPGLSDHDIVYTEKSIKPQILPQKPRVLSVYKKADCDA